MLRQRLEHSPVPQRSVDKLLHQGVPARWVAVARFVERHAELHVIVKNARDRARGERLFGVHQRAVLRAGAAISPKRLPGTMRRPAA
jgi:hypothetical protein